VIATGAVLALAVSCRREDNALARRMCEEADALDTANPRAALVLRRKIWEQLPTTGTAGAAECGRRVRRRMGEVRILVSADTRGAPATVDGCEWAAEALDVFEGSTRLPFREGWARRLMERCVDVVGRAWAREPDSARLRTLNDRLKKLAAKGR